MSVLHSKGTCTSSTASAPMWFINAITYGLLLRSIFFFHLVIIFHQAKSFILTILIRRSEDTSVLGKWGLIKFFRY